MLGPGPFSINMRGWPRTGRSERTYHRLIQLVQETGDAEIATRLGVPKSTVSGWIRRSSRDVVTVSGLEESAAALHIRVARLEQRVRRLGAMVRILFALFRILQPDLTRLRVPNGSDKRRLMRAIDRSRSVLGLRRVLKAIGLSASRLGAWQRAAQGCELEDQSSCPSLSPQSLTPVEVSMIGAMVNSPDYLHVPYRKTRLARSAHGQGDRLAVHLVSAGSRARLAPPPPSRPSGEAAHGDPGHEAARNLGSPAV